MFGTDVAIVATVTVLIVGIAWWFSGADDEDDEDWL